MSDDKVNDESLRDLRDYTFKCAQSNNEINAQRLNCAAKYVQSMDAVLIKLAKELIKRLHDVLNNKTKERNQIYAVVSDLHIKMNDLDKDKQKLAELITNIENHFHIGERWEDTDPL